MSLHAGRRFKIGAVRPSLALQLHPYSTDVQIPPRSGQTQQERPGAADAVQGASPRRAADRPGAGTIAQPGHRARHRRHGLGHRAAAAAGQFVRAPRRPAGRAHRAQVGRARASTRRRSAATWRVDRCPGRSCRSRSRSTSTPSFAKALGYDQSDPNQTLIGMQAGGARPSARRNLRHLRAAPREAPDAPPLAAAGHARRHRLDAGAGKAAARGPAGVRLERRHRGVDAAPPAAAGEVRRRREDRAQVRTAAEGRPAVGDQGSGRGRQPQRPHAGAARRHRLRQDLHHGEGDRGDAAPGAGAGAEQDAGGAALRRVQELLPRQRGRVFRLVLRLLPAGSLHPAHRHLHREGFLDQRADRPHAPLGDARAARTRRRDHRRLGVVHLRHRLGRDLFGDDLHASSRRIASTSAS